MNQECHPFFPHPLHRCVIHAPLEVRDTLPCASVRRGKVYIFSLIRHTLLLRGEGNARLSESGAVQTAVVDGLGQVFCIYLFSARQVGNGTGHLENTVHGAGGQPQLVNSTIQ